MKIEKLLLEVTRGESEPIGSLPDFYYGVNDFGRDLYENPTLDWEKILEEAKSKISSYLGSVIAYYRNIEKIKDLFKIEKPNQLENSEAKTSSIDPLDVLLESPKETLEGWLSRHLESMQECLDFYDENKNSAPFNYPVLKENKIPFWGTQDEFMAFMYLIDSLGKTYLGSINIDFSEKAGFKDLSEILNQKKTLSLEEKKTKQELKRILLKKKEFVNSLISTFHLVKYDGKTFIEEPINYQACYRNMVANSFEQISADKQKEMIWFFRRILNEIDSNYSFPKD